MILTCELGDVRNILIRLARYIEPVLPKQVGARTMLPFVSEQAPQNMNQEGRPARGCFDETKTEARKLLGNLISDDVAESEQRHDPSVAEGVIARDVEHLEDRFHAAAGVNADR